MVKKRILFFGLFLLSIIIPVATMMYQGPWLKTAGEVLVAGTDDHDHADKIEVFCKDRLSPQDAAHKEFKGHSHGAFITVDQNKNGLFDDDTRRPLVGFEGDNEVTIETYGGNDEIHIHCNRGELSHWLVINAGAGDDRIYGSATNEWLFGDLGNDVIFGNCDADCDQKRTCLKGRGAGDGVLQPVRPFFSMIFDSSSMQRDFIVMSSDDGQPAPVGDKTSRFIDDPQSRHKDNEREEAYCGLNDRCAVIGSDANDCIRGAMSGDTLVLARAGDDDIQTYSGRDIVNSGSGNDLVLLGAGDDQAYGDRGRDAFFGEEGDDRLDGGNENDTLSGGPGDDLLCGSDGHDVSYGGGGLDRASEDDNDTFTAIARVEKFRCYSKQPHERATKNIKPFGLKAHHLRDWIGLPRYRMIGTRKVPKGFVDVQQFDQSMTDLKHILKGYHISDARIVIHGSAVDGVAEGGKPFRYGGPEASDLNIEIQSQEILEPLRDKWLDKGGRVSHKDFDALYPEIAKWSERWHRVLHNRTVQTYGHLPVKRYWYNVIMISAD
ncbi:MAG: hypothetical protein HQM16_16695 [Deltaproteobacteria bacterium]|nr:hypothetical protein [Deltaproteobacteria bacterium]